jgi:hypothetical protein
MLIDDYFVIIFVLVGSKLPISKYSIKNSPGSKSICRSQDSSESIAVVYTFL